ncbi:MAG: HD domain-containing protein [Bacteroidales bacterium]|nr:HD domain-containing protein [Bacteroidales bacterium]
MENNQAKQFPQAIKHLQKVIEGSEFENNVWIVGGYARSIFLGLEPNDLDVVVSLPDGGIRFANWMESIGETDGSVVVYPTFGVGMFRLKKFPEVELECVMTRGEQYHDKNSRKPETTFGTIREDCVRRDFTVNALYLNVSSNDVYDFTEKGLDDLKNKLIRVTNDNSDIIFSEDPLRICRACRFASQLGFDIEKETFAAMKRNTHRLEIVSAERIQSELNKILMSQEPVKGLELLKDCGALEQFIPEFKETYSMTQNKYHDYNTVWEHTLKVVEHAQVYGDLTVMMAALLHDIGKINTRRVNGDKVQFIMHESVGATMAQEILKRLKYDNTTIRDVKFIVKNHMRFKSFGDNTPSDKSLRKFQYECKDKGLYDKCLALINADNMSHGVNYCLPMQVPKIMARTVEMIHDGEDMFDFKLPVTGEEIMEARGCQPGEEVGKCMEYLTKLCFNGVRKMDKENCLKMIKNFKIK